MARPRKSDAVIKGIVDSFAKKLAVALGGFIDSVARANPGKRVLRRAGRRARVLCYVPGCKNVAAPRFGMFCAAEHKNLSKSEKDKYRALHNNAAIKAAPKKK
jgi:hypothetical protein